MEKQDFIKIINNSQTIRECLMKMNRNDSSGSYKIFNKKINLYNIDISHFKNKAELMLKRYENGDLFIKKLSNDDIFIENSKVSRHVAKKRILSENLIDYSCNKCGSNNIWNGEKITLILDHKNGINNDHRIENLRFVCPNCNSTLKTHCRGHKGLINQIDKRTIRKERLETRKVLNRPSKEELTILLEGSNFSKIGRQYGVSDNCIRKWAKKYEIL